MVKIIQQEDIAKVIPEIVKDGDAVAWTTAGLCGFAEEVAIGFEEAFLATGHPRNLTLVHSCGCGDHKERGTNHLGHEGMVTKVISGHIGEAPKVGKLVFENKAECHLLPQGVITHLYRQMAGKKIGVITKVGLGTFADDQEGCGGKINEITKDDLVTSIEFEGERYLYYKPFKIDVAIIRGTLADTNGNLTMDKEPLNLEGLELASAVKNNGGIVIVQATHVVEVGSLHPKLVKVPGALVDYVMLSRPENHMQTKKTTYNPAFCGDGLAVLGAAAPMALDERKVIARRAAMELTPNSTLNLGIGMPDGVANVATEEGLLSEFTMTTELGNFGGQPGAGPDFPASWNSQCTVPHPNMFDFYDGGGLDNCVLGMAECDQYGNVNVSKFGPKVTGPGGFINISSAAKKVVFVGTMTAGGCQVEVKDGKLNIVNEGKVKKFVPEVEQVTFSGKYAAKDGRPIVYVTERAVFTLRDGKLTLIEIAPGLDLEKDVLSAMAFRPAIADDLKVMDEGIFQETWGKLRDIIYKN